MINLRQSAIGVLEVSYFANTVVVVDQALKAAQVELVSCHKRLGGKMCHTVLADSTSGVEAAMEAARAAGRIVGGTQRQGGGDHQQSPPPGVEAFEHD